MPESQAWVPVANFLEAVLDEEGLSADKDLFVNACEVDDWQRHLLLVWGTCVKGWLWDSILSTLGDKIGTKFLMIIREKKQKHGLIDLLFVFFVL
jgi:hypothetical protein